MGFGNPEKGIRKGAIAFWNPVFAFRRGFSTFIAAFVEQGGVHSGEVFYLIATVAEQGDGQARLFAL